MLNNDLDYKYFCMGRIISVMINEMVDHENEVLTS